MAGECPPASNPPSITLSNGLIDHGHDYEQRKRRVTSADQVGLKCARIDVSGDEDEAESQDESTYSEDVDSRLEGTVICIAHKSKKVGKECRCSSCRCGETLVSTYWNDLYRLNSERNDFSEYLMSFFTLKPVLDLVFENKEHMKSLPTLVPGCGDSPFTELVHTELQFRFVVGTDISEVAVQVMKSTQQSSLSAVQYLTDDMTNSKFAASSFASILDKSLIDCMFWCDDEDIDPEEVVAKTLEEYYRILIPGGCVVVVTTREADEFVPFVNSSVPSDIYHGLNPMPWFVTVMPVSVEADDCGRVPKNAKISIKENEIFACDQSPTNFKVFYAYILEKMWYGQVLDRLNEMISTLEV